ncbi:phosphoribosyl-ATP pyrophosphatase [Ignicoccus pacificus DSM 13166]|uniref:Phosphoribosyl-ATP pyrophosphatase n=1 Tax=Ignicoccus pacificus DSM 13166 TaxID=940294 RepID=A0A977K921_9CREN|nr:phosphoribosyl-ATP pyrophosphatase [Ignicoccus pacificus DSM 13166]
MDYLQELWEVILNRVKNPREGSYTSKIAMKGKGYAARKVGEEAVEVIVAALEEGKDSLVYEAADLIYHLMVLLAISGVSWEEVVKELESRARHRGGGSAGSGG